MKERYFHVLYYCTALPHDELDMNIGGTFGWTKLAIFTQTDLSMHETIMVVQVAEWLVCRSLTNAARVRFDLTSQRRKWEGPCSSLRHPPSLGGKVKPLT